MAASHLLCPPPASEGASDESLSEPEQHGNCGAVREMRRNLRRRERARPAAGRDDACSRRNAPSELLIRLQMAGFVVDDIVFL